MQYDKSFDSKVAQALNANKLYYEMMQQWHELQGGLAVEPDVKRLIEAECRPGSRILEAGSGSGSITNWFATRYPNVKFVGVDISQIGVSIACEKAPDNADFKVGDLKKLPFREGSFDFCFSQSVIEHIVGWEEAIIELRRVLISDGRLLIRVNNGDIDSISRRRAIFKYLFSRNYVSRQTPSFDLRNDNWKDHMSNFDVQEIPSDVLLKTLRKANFAISYFTTGIERWRHSDVLKERILSYLNFWPFNHLGSTTIVLAEKRSYLT
jgi:ubiquinone/menaquinone biosynthesis C-methylase UbiE